MQRPSTCRLGQGSIPVPSVFEKVLHDLRFHTSGAGLPPPVRGEWACLVVTHPWWIRYELKAALSATTFNKHARSRLDIRTEHLRESVT